MEKRIRKKKITIKGYITRSLATSAVYFMILIAWQSVVFVYNKNQSGELPGWDLVLFFLAVAVWVFCYFEIRTVTNGGERFLGYKSYILYFLKLILMPIVVLVTFLMGKITDNIIYPILIDCGICLIYYIFFAVFLLPYRAYVKGNCELYISYRVLVRKWYFEGNVGNLEDVG